MDIARTATRLTCAYVCDTVRLSRRIDKLETILGARLFNRTTRDVELTALGQVFLDRARSAGRPRVRHARHHRHRRKPTSRVTVACVPSAATHFLPSVVSSFSERYPLIRVRVIDEAAGAVMVSVVSGESDFGITFMGNQVPGVDFEPIHTDPFVVAMPRRHALAGRKTLSWKSLETERLIAVARTSGNRQLLDDALAKAGVNPSYRLEVSHIATLLGMVERGSGLRPYRAWPCRNSIRRWSASRWSRRRCRVYWASPPCAARHCARRRRCSTTICIRR